ncbi:mitochondrial import receptor subunit TOM22 homolog [Dendronephthya gigantea]|uniref:mitochondrial import receptor subunit TOM22 homolog n=1 Tax=Dendronephthya gigantea TaxID=151771 RepID=UPI00106D8396|nr:mitochondrial import receptor subunit TOM22 homolog [Dendronephthya gigantea]
MDSSPSNSATSARIEELENLDDIEDETITERLIGLTEMFPESVRNFFSTTTDLAIKGTKKLYSFGGSTLWIVSTSFMVLALPLIFEVERAQAEEAEKQQQRQILLGPGAATNPGLGGPGMALR